MADSEDIHQDDQQGQPKTEQINRHGDDQSDEIQRVLFEQEAENGDGQPDETDDQPSEKQPLEKLFSLLFHRRMIEKVSVPEPVSFLDPVSFS